MNNLIPKEISWLSFNQRVLQEASNPAVPLIERLHFLGIYSNNLDEFFRVRVATLRRLTLVENKTKDLFWINPSEVLDNVRQIVLQQRKEYEKVYSQLFKDLRKKNIYFVNENELTETQCSFVKNYINEVVRPRLMPVMLDQAKKFPDLKDDAIYLAVELTNIKNEKSQYAIVRIPSDILHRFIELPSANSSHYIMYLDDVIRFGLKDIFSAFKFSEVNAYTIKITKDAELDIDDDLTESFVSKVSKSIKQRRKGLPVRLLYDAQIPVKLLEYLKLGLKLKESDPTISGGRYHNTKDFMNFPFIGSTKLHYPKWADIPFSDFDQSRGIIRAIRDKDRLLNFPYHSFHYFIDLLREASIDPKVKEVKITLYRLAKNSSVVNALLNALKNGKEVTAVVELQARFDEEANIYWAHRLHQAGAKVIYGILDLKVHAKVCLVTRLEKKHNRLYACLSTGNFNEDTAEVFSDMMLFTAHQEMAKEADRVFDFFERNYDIPGFSHLLVSPFYFRKKILDLIQNEINNKQSGKEAYIHLKLNNLVDEEVIEALTMAAKAGVEVVLNIRGMFSIANDDKEPLFEAFGIVDRYLEHVRLLIFANGGNPLYYLSSADLMPRNIDRRVEITWPVYDKDIKKTLQDIFDIQRRDNVKARLLDAELKNEIRNKGTKPFNSQEMTYQYFLRE